MEKDKYAETGEKVQAAGKKVQQVGCALTLLITLPILGFALLGWAGAAIGGIIGIVIFAAMFMKGK